MIPIIMSGGEIDGESLSLSVSADRSVFDVEIPQKTRVSDDSAAEMRFDSGDMDGRVSGSGGLSAVESEGTRVLEGEMGLDGGDGDFEVGKSEMECDEVEVGGSTVKAEGLGFNDGNGSFGGGNGGIGHLVVRSEEGSGSVSSGCGYGEIKRKTEIDDRGDDNLFDEMECKVVRSEDVRVSLEPGSKTKREMEARVSDINAEGLHFSGGIGGFDGGNDGMEGISTNSDMEVVKETGDHDLNSSHHDVSTDAISGTWVLDGGGSLSYGFEYGDMVWGKVKSHPWWPGHIFNEAFASSSVRRMRRDGHVLVAFFGDSSYGWFDPAELIHFEPNYAEKSRQTNSRNFMKAVEEATDEASRRTALGLACRCRNPFNFRPAIVPGYFVVDVFDFEPGGVYSGKQIDKARDSFQPDEALSFVEGAALMPFEGDHKSIDWIKNMALLLAYRKAVFEEFDETYAQAFGMEPVRPSRDAFGVLEQPDRAPPRAPLSGPLVIAEALGERKNSGKPLKVKGLLKKDKYLFKRRDELNEKRAAKQEFYHASQLQANVVPSLAFKEASGNFPSDDYVLQKRAPASLGKHAISTKQAQREVVSQEYGTPVIKLDSVVSQDFVVSPTVVPVDFPMSQPSAYGLGVVSMQGGTEEGKLPMESLAKQMDASPEMTGKTKLDETIRTTSIISDLGKSESLGTMDGVGKIVRQEVEGIFVEDNREWDQVMGNSNVGRLSMSADDSLSGRAPGTPSGDVVVENITKSLKRPIEADLGQQKYIMGEKKKKKKKKDAGLETGLDHQRKHPKIVKDGEVSRKLAGKSIGIGLDGREHPLIDSERKDGIRSDSATLFSKVDTVNAELKLPKLVNDLLALALDPFHAIERNSPAIVRQVFLKFRSLVYQKSLVLPPASESETSEPGAAKSVSGSALQELSTGNAEAPPTIEGKEAPASKSLKRPSRLDDPSKAGRKRGPSDRQEEMSAKRLKKLNDLKQLALEKKAGGQKTLDGQKKVGQKETVAVAPTQPTKMDSVKRQELPARVTKPTALVMKFPPKTTLPSAPELKARFARYGPLDLSGMRVYWRSSTCRIVFKYKSDAQAAYNHAIRNNSLFGQVKVRYILRELELSALELPETEKRRVDNGADDGSPPRPSSSDFVGEPRLQRQTSVQLKSCLKKPSGDEAPPAAVLAKDSPRVKFLLGGDDSKGEQMMASSSNNGSSADGAPSSSMAFDVNINNIKSTMVIPPLPLPLPFPSRNPDMLLPPPPHSLPFLQPSRLPDVLLTPPPLPLRPPFSHAMDLHESRGHFSKAPQHAHQALYNEGEGKKESAVDISHQLLTLLMRCSDIVTDVKSTLGYAPYHPL